MRSVSYAGMQPRVQHARNKVNERGEPRGRKGRERTREKREKGIQGVGRLGTR